MGGRKNPGNANLPIGAGKVADVVESMDGSTYWHSRGYLPHFESPFTTQHVTFHLADSLPEDLLRSLRSALETQPEGKRDAERRRKLDEWIDAGYGACILRRADVAALVEGALLHFDGRRYRLIAWVVMPNHVHILFEPVGDWSVAKIVAGWKKFAARIIRDRLRSCGQQPRAPVWHREYWDRYIRDERHFWQAVEYIEMNPVKAGLVKKAAEWRWGSAFHADRKGRQRADANREIGVPGG